MVNLGPIIPRTPPGRRWDQPQGRGEAIDRFYTHTDNGWKLAFELPPNAPVEERDWFRRQWMLANETQPEYPIVELDPDPVLYKPYEPASGGGFWPLFLFVVVFSAVLTFLFWATGGLG